ncbi:hypothetical protein NliqN6_3759 [Naganishia liquefaciens]|uniref:Enoyl reductase (ER) domain-containing protein n=1 Tax=Naganishia liquefaciens TaxID=104408 RepID=A0A8H3YGM0_9TREE|nr:hypothetical protein NliqN6_3759 [Naganishia liquefaciens]
MNTRIVLANRPAEGPIPPNTFKQEQRPVPKKEDLKDGEVIVRVMWLSLDPAMRGWLRDARSYIPPVKINEVMRAAGVGKVVASKCPKRQVGDEVEGTFGWQEYWVGPSKYTELLHPPKGSSALDYLGPLGSSGLTAYFGITDVGQIKDGDTVVVSGAAGSVGLIVTQIAISHPKCKVIGIAGSTNKCKTLKDLGCHAVINYKDQDWRKQFKDSVGFFDIYFDNVGGELLDFALTRMNPHAKIVMCGAISDYNSGKPYRLGNYQALIAQKGTMQGFIVMDYTKRYHEGRAYLAKMLSEGKLQYKYHVIDNGGVNGCEDGLRGLFKGVNEGKMVVKVWDGQMERSSKL